MRTLSLSAKYVGEICALSATAYGDDEDTASLNNPKRNQLYELLSGLSAEQKQELSALTWLGRGDFSEEGEAEFDRALQHARGFNGTDTAEYLIGKPLHTYLPLGLDRLKQFGYVLSE